MEVFAHDTASGREEAVCIDTDATLLAVKRLCGEALGMGNDVELCVGGQRVACCDTDHASNIASFSSGCRVGVTQGIRDFVTRLRRRTITLDALPLWARLRRECVLAALQDKGSILTHWVHPTLWGDREVMLAAVKADISFYHIAAAAAHPEDRASFALEAMRATRSPLILVYSGDAVRSDKATVLDMISCLPECFLWVAPSLRADRDVVLAAWGRSSPDVGGTGHADLSALAHRDVALAALLHGLDCDSSPWLHDKPFVLEALQQHPRAFRQASAALRADKEVVLRAVAGDSANYSLASPALQGDAEVALCALRSVQWGGADYVASLAEILRAYRRAAERPDPTLLTEALSEAGDAALIMAAWFADCNEKGVMLQAMRALPSTYKHAGKALRADSEVALTALRHPALRAERQSVARVFAAALSHREVALAALPFGVAGCEAPSPAAGLPGGPAWLHDKPFVLEALQQHPYAFRHASAALRADKEVVLRAVAGDSANLRFASPALRGDAEVAAVAAGCGGMRHVQGAARSDTQAVLRMLGLPIGYQREPLEDASRDDRAVGLHIAENVPELFPLLSYRLRDDLTVALPAITRQPGLFMHAGDAVRGTKEAALAAFPALHNSLEYHGTPPGALLAFASSALQNDPDVARAALHSLGNNHAYVSPALLQTVLAEFAVAEEEEEEEGEDEEAVSD